MTKTVLLSAALSLLMISCSVDTTPDWKIADNPLITKWALQIDPTKPWNTYPRPGMVRKEWVNLNGLWDYAVTGIQEQPPAEWDGKILVPYPIESALSGVKRGITKDDLIWYKTNFKIPSGWKGKKILINFEASDWETKVWVNGLPAGTHRGGYDPFTFDITGMTGAGKTNELIVAVWDPADRGNQPRGKQVSKPGGIWYTPSSGIWQTVWIEPVNKSYIESFRVYTSVDDPEIRVEPVVVCPEEGFLRMSVTKSGKYIGSVSNNIGQELKLEIENPLLWSPDNPHLYDLKLELIVNDIVTDAITTKTGIRSISLGKTEDGFTRILLNNEFLFQNGPLDQGFWPDGLYTPPSEEAMIYDLWMLKEMGFNMLRKHVKVENRVFYHWCDKIGLLVWQDMPSGDRYISGNMPDIAKENIDDVQFRLELARMIETKFNHPSIIMWVPFNEGWGQYDTEGITRFIREKDPTRLVNSASGWTDRGTGDILDVHHYPDPRAPKSEENRAIVLGEFGGLGLPVENHTWEKRNWGYRNMTDREDLLRKYEEYYVTIRDLVKNKGLSAVVYTQTTDVETETNGLMTYDRKIDKMGADNIFKAHAGLVPPLFDNPSSIFIDSFLLKLSIPDSVAIIRYTINGTEPGIASEKYSGPVMITEPVTVKARAWYGNNASRTVECEVSRVAPVSPADSTGYLTKGLSVSIFEGDFTILPETDTLSVSRKTHSDIISHTLSGFDSQFCLLFEGFIEIPETGVYGFHLTSDDGSRLTVGGQLVADNDGIHGMIEKSGFIALGAGLHEFRLVFFQRLGGVGLNLEMEYPGGEKKVVPPGLFFH